MSRNAVGAGGTGEQGRLAGFLRRYWVHILLGLVLAFIFRGYFESGSPATVVGHFSPSYYTRVSELFGLPYIWALSPSLGTRFAGLGGNVLHGLCSYPWTVAWGLATRLGIPVSWSERLFFLPMPLLAALSSYYLGKTLFEKRQTALAVAACFSMCPFLINEIGFGMPTYTISFALAPLPLALLIRAKRARGLRYPVLAGLALALQCSYDPRFCLLTLLIAAAGWIVASVGSLRRGKEGAWEAVRWAGYLAVAVGVLVGLHLFWMLPAGLGLSRDLSAYGVGKPEYVSFLSNDKLVNTFTLFSSRLFNKTSAVLEIEGFPHINPFFILFPMISFGAVMGAVAGARRNLARAGVAVSASALALVGVFLAKGSNQPLGSVYSWLFESVPGFDLMRNPNKMYLFVAIGFSILFGVAAEIAAERLRGWRQAPGWIRREAGKLVALAVLVLMCLLLLVPLLNSYSTSKIPEGYTEMDRMLEEDNRFYRTFWYPATHRDTPTMSDHPAISASSILNRKLTGLIPENALDSDLEPEGMVLTAVESPLMPGLLDAMAVGKTIIPEISDSDDARRARTFSPSMEYCERMLADISGDNSPSPVGGSKVYDASGFRGHMFVPEKTVGILGGWGTAEKACEVPGVSIDKSAYVFSNEGEVASSALTGDSRFDCLLSGLQGREDAIMPFVDPGDLVPVVDAAGEDETGWQSIDQEYYERRSGPYMWLKYICDRDLDYGLGAAWVGVAYKPPPPGWEEEALPVTVLDASAYPLPFGFDSSRLRVVRDYSKVDSGIASLRCSPRSEPGGKRRGMRSIEIPAQPVQPYGIRFSIAGEGLKDCRLYVEFVNQKGNSIGKRSLETVSGTFDFREVKRHFTTPAGTSGFRFKVDFPGDATPPGVLQLGNVEVFNLLGISEHPELELPVNVEEKGSYNLIVRCAEWEEGGGISFLVDDSEYFYVDTGSSEGRMSWRNLGKLELEAGDHKVRLENLEGKNLVNALALVTDKELAAAEEELSAAANGRDLSYVFNPGSDPGGGFTYSDGRMTRTGSFFSPASRWLSAASTDDVSLPAGTVLAIGDIEHELSRPGSLTGLQGRVEAQQYNVRRGTNTIRVTYPVESLLEIPASGPLPTGGSQEWYAEGEGTALKAETSRAGGENALVGDISPGDALNTQVIYSREFEVSAGEEYAVLFRLEGVNSSSLKVFLVMYDEDGNQVKRSLIAEHQDGSSERDYFLSRTAPPEARYASLEISSRPLPDRSSGWSLSRLVINREQVVTPPMCRMALVPQEWALPAGREAASPGAPPARVEILDSSPTRYRVKVTGVRKQSMLVFSEAYDSGWELRYGNETAESIPAYTLLNGFSLTGNGEYDLVVTYGPQRWVNVGLIGSILTLLACLVFLLIRRRRRPVSGDGGEPISGEANGEREITSATGPAPGSGLMVRVRAVALLTRSDPGLYATLGAGLVVTLLTGLLLALQAERLSEVFAIVAFILISAGTLLGLLRVAGLTRAEEGGSSGTRDRRED